MTLVKQGNQRPLSRYVCVIILLKVSGIVFHWLVQRVPSHLQLRPFFSSVLLFYSLSNLSWLILSKKSLYFPFFTYLFALWRVCVCGLCACACLCVCYLSTVCSAQHYVTFKADAIRVWDEGLKDSGPGVILFHKHGIKSFHFAFFFLSFFNVHGIVFSCCFKFCHLWLFPQDFVSGSK